MINSSSNGINVMTRHTGTYTKFKYHLSGLINHVSQSNRCALGSHDAVNYQNANSSNQHSPALRCSVTAGHVNMGVGRCREIGKL